MPSKVFADRKTVASLERTELESPRQQPLLERRQGHGFAPYLSNLYDAELLTPESEAFLFRKMNFLKYRAAKRRKLLRVERPDRELMNLVEADLAEADRIKQHLIEANLRLVVSVAKKFVESASNLPELVSDGNISLMRAVEKFDVDRGFKFSTYATYAIRRNFFRTIIQARKERQRYVSGDDELLRLSPSDGNDQQLTEPQFEQLKGWLSRLMGSLSPREQLIISLRFGLQSGEEPQTLQDIAKSMGVCKERVRQLQSRAMSKLQKAAEKSRTEVADLL